MATQRRQLRAWRTLLRACALGLAVLLAAPAWAQGAGGLVRVVEELSATPRTTRLLESGSDELLSELLSRQPRLLRLTAKPLGEPVAANAERAAERTCRSSSSLPVSMIGAVVSEAESIAAAPRGAAAIEVDPGLLASYEELFAQNGIPMTTPGGQRPERVVMVSTHGYWGDPPPAGKPDTGGQTYWVLQVSKELARSGRQVLILARHFEGAPRVEKLGDGVWLVRIQAGGEDFVRKEDLYPLVPQLAEDATAAATAFQAQGVFGHYADGMTIAAEVAARLEVPLVQTSHSLGVSKMRRMQMSPTNPRDLLDPELNYWNRNQLEEAAMRAANFKIANNPGEPADWARDYNVSAGEHQVFPGGAGQAFFDVARRTPDPAVLQQLGLQDTRYLFFWGRMSEAKNIEGLVQILGEARRLNPSVMNDVKVAVAGGTPGFEASSEEETLVKDRVLEVMDEYGLSDDVRFLGSQDHSTIAELARGAIAYVGPQRVEPFGMAAGEAMAAGVPILISREAGIARWLEDGVNAYIIDPANPAEAAGKLLTLITDDAARAAMAERGQQLAVENFSWGGIANQQAAILDDLFARGVHGGGRAFHRATPTWRGDALSPTAEDFAAAEALVPRVVDAAQAAKNDGQRLVVSLSGTRGTGDNIAQLVAMMLPDHGLRARVLPRATGSTDLQRLDDIATQARNPEVGAIAWSSESRTLDQRQYADVPVDLAGVDVVFVSEIEGSGLWTLEDGVSPLRTAPRSQP